MAQDPTAGHVAVVDSVGSTTFVAVQENTAGKYTWKDSCASCFLHASSNVPAAADGGSDAAAADAGWTDADVTDAPNDAAPSPADAASPPPPQDAGDVAASGAGCSSAPRAPSNGWIAVALGFVLTALRRRHRKAAIESDGATA